MEGSCEVYGYSESYFESLLGYGKFAFESGGSLLVVQC